MKKLVTKTGKIHFGSFLKEEEDGSNGILMCQPSKKRFRVVLAHPNTVLSCKRCWSMRVHDVPSALQALGIPKYEYLRFLQEFHHVPRQTLGDYLSTLPGGEDIIPQFPVSTEEGH